MGEISQSQFGIEKRQFITLKKIQRSRKDYRHLFGALPAMQPELLFLSPILNQDGNKCTAFASSAVRQPMTGHEYDSEGQFGYELQFEGITSAPNGLGFKTPLGVGCKIGFCGLPQKIAIDKASAYFFVSKNSGMDLYDSIKVSISQARAPLLLAVDWLTDWDTGIQGIVPNTKTSVLGGHCTKIAGWKQVNGKEYLVVQNSWGILASGSDQGLYYFSRETVNKYFGTYGIAYFSDDPNAKIKKLGLLQSLIQNLIALYTTLIIHGNGTQPPRQTLYWSTPVAARHSVRVICDEEGLSWDDKNILDACVHVESNYNPLAEHMNKDKEGNVWSTDYGIAQINDYFNIGEGKPFPSVQYILENPEACIRFMAKQWKSGNQHLWASYTSGAYKRYL